MKKFFLTVFLCLSFFGYSQGENNNWYFGSKIGLNFSGNTPQFLSNSPMISMYSSGTVSDSNGNLLFYTNGQQVWNRNHEVMLNGDIDQEGVQTAIVKNPTNPNLYYIFGTGKWFNGGFAARYTVVNMALGNIGSNGLPLGDVEQNLKNIPIFDASGNEFTEARGVTIVPHGDHNSFWVLITTGSKMYSYRLSSSGLSSVPVVNDLNNTVGYAGYYGVGIKASPKVNACNFSHLLSITYPISSTGETNGLVCSFNNLSGLITSDYNLSVAGMAYAEFNQYANVLYIAKYQQGVTLNTNTMLYAVDLLNSTNSNVIHTPLDTGLPDMYGYGIPITLQRNTKGEIYFYLPYYNLEHSLGKIMNPDVYGSSSVNLNGLLLTGLVDPAIYVGSANNLPQLVPKLYEGGNNACLASINLSTPENNTNYTYQASNSITTQLNYTISPGKDITMKAGNNVTLLPGTFVSNGSKYFATIENCNCSGGEIEAKKQNLTNKMVLDLRSLPTDKKNAATKNGIIKNVKIYPNPVSEILNITSDSDIKNVFVVDISGKKLNVKLDGNKIDVRSLPSGTYLISIETKEGKTTQKFIKK